MTLTTLLDAPQFNLRQADKEALLLDELIALTRHHIAHCPDYARLVEVAGPPLESAQGLADLPFLPVSLFKSHTLKSIPDDQVQTVMTSSGTSGQQPSRIFVDRATSALQTRALAKVVTHVVGRQRLPMLIADTRAVFEDPELLSARGAGVLGMMRFGRDHTFLLDQDMRLQEDVLHEFLKARGGSPFLIFGFTFMVWKYFYEPARHLNLKLDGGILIHSGGWKKLAASAVDNATFKGAFAADLGLRRIYNFYGMVEQIGSIFLEGEDGLLYAPNFSDVIIRDPQTWAPAPLGEVGVIQVLSALPRSYPGHSLLTEDLGVLEAVDSGCGGRLGKAIRVVGRVPEVELRGCSDIHAFDNARDLAPA
jgi:hypothetical protein